MQIPTRRPISFDVEELPQISAPSRRLFSSEFIITRATGGLLIALDGAAWITAALRAAQIY